MPCLQLLQFKQQYDSALRAWGRYAFPLHDQTLEARSTQVPLHLMLEASEKRNAASERLLDHQRNCLLCKSKGNESKPGAMSGPFGLG
jgi:hypothetical protein